jgi:transposase
MDTARSSDRKDELRLLRIGGRFPPRGAARVRDHCDRRRWRVERLFAWMQNFRRLVTRWEYHIENLLGFVHLAWVQMLFRHL